MENEYYNHTNYEYTPEPQEPNNSYEPKEKPVKKKKGGAKWLVCIAMALVFGIVASSTFQVSNYVWKNVFGTITGGEQETPNSPINSATSGKETNVSTITSDVADISEAVMPSVVSITNMSVQQVQDWFFGMQEYEQQSSGSGIIIGQNDTELLVVTNNHVVANSTTLTVTFIDDASAKATIKGTDSSMDLAILAVPLKEIKAETKAKIKVATLGDSKKLRVGEPAIAIGNALGYGQSVTTGIISALDREVDEMDAKFIQTDAAINPGNSGGALLNAAGEVIGINTAKVSDSAVEGMGYAIPISDVSDILDTLMNRATRTKVPEARRGYIGIEGTTVDANMSEIYSVPQGIFIRNVIEGGAAEKAGLNKGSVITKLDGTSVDTMEALKAELEYYAIGDKVTLTILVPQPSGDYKESEVEVTLQKQS